MGVSKLLKHHLYTEMPPWWHDINGLVQERRNSSALAMELRFSCTNPSICKNFYALLTLCEKNPLVSRALMLYLLAWTSCSINSWVAGDLSHHDPHVMSQWCPWHWYNHVWLSVATSSHGCSMQPPWPWWAVVCPAILRRTISGCWLFIKSPFTQMHSTDISKRYGEPLREYNAIWDFIIASWSLC